MLSTDQNASPSSQNSNCPPKRFLRKGEGLKRFAAYKPPLPTTVKKVERRRTFVKFNLDLQNKAGLKREPPLHFLPPEILNDDSINLSTEIPKIAPPKIIHTPIRPNRNALGIVTNRCTHDDDDLSINSFTDSQINGNIDNLMRKIEQKKCFLNQHEEHREFNDSFTDFERNNHDQIQRKHHQPTNHSQQLKQQQKQRDLGDETDDSACGSNSPSLAQPLSRTMKVGPKFDLSKPHPGTCILGLSKQIQRIESTVNELREKIEKCECGAPKSSPEIPLADNQPMTTRSRRPVTRAATKAAKSQPNNHSDKTNKRTKEVKNDDKSNRPSAGADNCNSTKEVLNSLANEIAELKSQIESMRISD